MNHAHPLASCRHTRKEAISNSNSSHHETLQYDKVSSFKSRFYQFLVLYNKLAKVSTENLMHGSSSKGAAIPNRYKLQYFCIYMYLMKKAVPSFLMIVCTNAPNETNAVFICLQLLD